MFIGLFRFSISSPISFRTLCHPQARNHATDTFMVNFPATRPMGVSVVWDNLSMVFCYSSSSCQVHLPSLQSPEIPSYLEYTLKCPLNHSSKPPLCDGYRRRHRVKNSSGSRWYLWETLLFINETLSLSHVCTSSRQNGGYCGEPILALPPSTDKGSGLSWWLNYPGCHSGIISVSLLSDQHLLDHNHNPSKI